MTEQLEMRTKDLSQEKIRLLGELFPNCITESKENEKVVRSVDFDALRQELSNHVVEGPKERYQFTWPDKNKARVLANTPTTMTLRPCREESVDFDTTKNLYIEGDNLEVLKILRETYLGKVKMIYIDPPYNTGNDFVYNDDFSMTSEKYSELSGDDDDSGNRLFLNSSSNGRFHTDWLNMIYPRLLLAKDFLSSNGSIFISIDDNEISNLKKICDEIFGEKNFVSIINWKGRGGRQDSRYFASIHEYILCYARDISNFESGSDLKTNDCYPKYDSEKRRNYKTQLLRKWGSNSRREDRPNLYYPITAPDGSEVFPMLNEVDEGRWRWGKETMKKALNDGLVEFVKKDDLWIPYEKIFEPDEGSSSTKKYTTWIDDIGNGTKQIKEMFGSSVFDYSKSTDIIVHFLKMANVKDNDIVLDFFSGSSTTAHAVMDYNDEEGSNMSYIMVQLPELCPIGSKAYDSDYRTISEIGKERIRRAGNEIRRNNTLSAVDVGFRVFKCDSSCMRDVFYSSDRIVRNSLEDYVNVVKNDRKPEDLLIQMMLELGIELSSKFKQRDINEHTVFSVDDGYLVACFDDSIDGSTIVEISKEMSGCIYAVFRSGLLMSDEMLSNIEQIFKTYSPQTKIRIL